MRFAIGLPNVGAYGDPQLLVELGIMAERSGWDGVFIWDHVAYREPGWPVADPQVAVAALAATTKHIRLGVLMVALPRRRPWKVARELASVDVLSGGRAAFGAGLGSQALHEYEAFGEQGDAKVRAERLDEALEVIVGLWSGAPFTYEGKGTTRSRTASFCRAPCSDRGSPYGSPVAGRRDDHSPALPAGMASSRLTATPDTGRR